MENFAIGVVIMIFLQASIYWISYLAGRGWFKAKLEFSRQHMNMVSKEFTDDRQSDTQ